MRFPFRELHGLLDAQRNFEFLEQLFRGVRVNKTAATSIVNNTATAVPFDGERYKDAAAMHANAGSNTRLVCVAQGRYLVAATCSFAANATGGRFASLTVNGTTQIAGIGATSVSAGASWTGNVVTVWNFNQADYVELVVQQTSGGNLNLMADAVGDGTGIPTHFLMQRIA